VANRVGCRGIPSNGIALRDDGTNSGLSMYWQDGFDARHQH
jgi:hypothetical protein